jgi:hypothetical protein
VLLSALVVIVLGAVTGASTPTLPPIPASPLSRAQAESLRGKLLELERRAKRAGPVTATPATSVLVTQGEINSYVNLVLGPQLPAGLRNVEFRLDSGRIEVHAMADLDQVKAQMGVTSIWNPLSLLSGMVSIELAARLKCDGGFGTFDLDGIRIGPMAVPPALLSQLVASATRTQQNPAGFDILAPFRLPYGLRRLRVQPGRASLEY